MIRVVRVVLALLLFTHPCFAADAKFTREQFQEDFEFLCREVANTYAYFEFKATRWNDVQSLYRGDLARVTSRTEFVTLLERAVDELYDPHAQLNTNTPASARLVPSGTDLWAEWRDAAAVITQVRPNSDAARAGIVTGTRVASINDVTIAAAVDNRLGRSYPHATSAARDWALRSVLAGLHNTPRLLSLQTGESKRQVTLPAPDQFRGQRAAIEHSEVRPGVGYIRFNDSLGDDSTIEAFDAALTNLRSTRALIIDLRDTPSGGNSTVARGILGRFVASELPYQKHVLTMEERDTHVRRSWLELVTPRGEFRYTKPVVVLVSRWTGSMGEGLALGFDGTGAGSVVGTSMAQLVGATYTITLPHTQIRVNVPAERLYHVNGTPRENFVPKAIDANSIGAPDPFVSSALKVLERK